MTNSNPKVTPSDPALGLLYRQFEHDLFARHVGIDILEIRPGYARVTATVQQSMLNSLGTTHGGAVFTVADFALAIASNSHGEAAVATNVSINFIKATEAGDVLEATATEENRTRKTGLYRIEVINNNGDKVAIATASVYRLGKPLTGELGPGVSK